MHKKEAEKRVADIAAGRIELVRSDHFIEEEKADGLCIFDVLGILRVPESISSPEWSEKHKNHKVEVVGCDMDSRAAKVVLGLCEDGTCIGITVTLLTKRG